MLLSLLTAPAILGFASSLGGYHAADPVDGDCTDTSNVVMSGVTGGKTCADLAAEGRCASTDDLVKTVMEKNCMASCGACGEGRASRAYVQNGGADGDWVLKEYNGGYATTALSESAAMARLCPSTRGPYIHEGLLRLDSCPPGSCARGTSVGQQVEVCCVMPCCTRRGFEPGSRPAARLHALPAPPPAPRPAAGARRGARRATRSRAAARTGGWGMGREGSGDAGTAVSRRAFLKKYTCSTLAKAVAPVRSRPPPRRPSAPIASPS